MITQLDTPCWVARWRSLGPNPLGEPHFPDAHAARLEIIRMLKHDAMVEVAHLPLPRGCWEIRCDTCPATLTASEFPEALEFDVHAETADEAKGYARDAGWVVLPDLSCYCPLCRDAIGLPRKHLRSVTQGAQS